MEQYIPKSVLVTRIERLMEHYNESAKEFGDEGYGDNVLMEQCKANTCKHILSFIDTLEVKEVDLEKELESWRHSHFHGRRDKEASGEYLERVTQLGLANHFFELGLKAQKGE